MNPTVHIEKQIDLQHGVVELRSDNILTFRPDVARFKEYNIDVLKDLHRTFIEITDGVPRPYLCDNRYVAGFMNKKEQQFINEKIGEFATKAGLITSSSLIQVLVNSYTSLFKPKVKIKLFRTEKEAVDWLLSSKE